VNRQLSARVGRVGVAVPERGGTHAEEVRVYVMRSGDLSIRRRDINRNIRYETDEVNILTTLYNHLQFLSSLHIDILVFYNLTDSSTISSRFVNIKDSCEDRGNVHC